MTFGTPSQRIIVCAAVVTASGIADSFLNQKAVTPVIIGSYVFILVLAIADSFGGGIAEVSGGLALVATVFVILTEFPWQALLDLLKNNPNKATSSSASTQTKSIQATPQTAQPIQPLQRGVA